MRSRIAIDPNKHLSPLTAGNIRWVKLAVISLGACVFAVSCIKQAERIAPTITSSERSDVIARTPSNSKFANFSHIIDDHKTFECISCHRREGKQRELEFAEHESCVGCHMNQFIDSNVTDENRAFCAICHENVGSNDPPMRSFPTEFNEGFNMRFEHAAHDNGEGRPAQGCAFCHSPAGAAQTIPSGIDTHNNCYTCHTSESKIGNCNVCHEIAPYRRTLASQYNFKAIFRHSDHTVRQGVSCSECHSIVAKAPQGRQVTNISVLQHRTTPGNNCLQCHNGSRAFHGNDITQPNTCIRCHTGMSTPNLPAETYTEDDTLPET